MKTNDKILNNEYTIIGVLGKGSYGKVYKIQENNHLKRVYALKILNDSESKEKFLSETKILHLLEDQPNILSLYSCKEYENDLYIITPYKNHGNLKEYIEANGILDEDEAKRFLTVMLDVLEFALDCNPPIYHKDIKPENILLHKTNDTIDYFLADWGLSDVKSSSRSANSSGTLDYKAPEVYKRKRYDNTDIYSLGIVLHYILTRKSPYGYNIEDENIDEASIMFSHIQDEPKIDENLSQNMKNIISKMLIKEPRQRANINEIRELLKDNVRESFEANFDFLESDEKEDNKDDEISKLKAQIEKLQTQTKNSNLPNINNSKVWIDKDTSLMWQVEIGDKECGWKDIQECADKLNKKNYGGYNDWRVPDIDELRTILTKKSYENHISYSEKTFIKEPLLKSMTMGYQWFWSSTKYKENSSKAWVVYFNLGYDGNSGISNAYYVRCVR
ncbi:MAG: protein kinase [Campylobacterota bacterium]|nr:protein kinase [Campylobacterota bacterium]